MILPVVLDGGTGAAYAARAINNLEDPEPVPETTDYAWVESDVPVVVQHTRLDSRQGENALLSTVAYAE